MNDFEVTFWHMINTKLLEDGMWSKYKFNPVLVKQQDKRSGLKKPAKQSQGGPLSSNSQGVLRSPDHDEFADVLLMTALTAKKLCNTAEDYEIFEEFVFHNLDAA
mmetsp:Transcript_3437/g.5158  ORF Transcript_3437/g.5158 Transcript_3437/m.5158 type:complete len:105 (+) Transcript_3437:586-900(+)